MSASHGYLNDPFRGMSAEDRARAKAFVDNQRTIAARREAAARRLLAPPGPAQAVREAWAPVSMILTPPPDAIGTGPSAPPVPAGDVDFFQGEGPPTNVPGAGPGDTYLDTTTGDLYELE